MKFQAVNAKVSRSRAAGRVPETPGRWGARGRAGPRPHREHGVERRQPDLLGGLCARAGLLFLPRLVRVRRRHLRRSRVGAVGGARRGGAFSAPQGRRGGPFLRPKSRHATQPSRCLPRARRRPLNTRPAQSAAPQRRGIAACQAQNSAARRGAPRRRGITARWARRGAARLPPKMSRANSSTFPVPSCRAKQDTFIEHGVFTSTRGGTRLVRLVRGRGGGGGVPRPRRAWSARAGSAPPPSSRGPPTPPPPAGAAARRSAR